MLSFRICDKDLVGKDFLGEVRPHPRPTPSSALTRRPHPPLRLAPSRP